MKKNEAEKYGPRSKLEDMTKEILFDFDNPSPNMIEAAAAHHNIDLKNPETVKLLKAFQQEKTNSIQKIRKSHSSSGCDTNDWTPNTHSGQKKSFRNVKSMVSSFFISMISYFVRKKLGEMWK